MTAAEATPPGDSIDEELVRIYRLNDGYLTADDVVDAAEQLDSPLHPMFEWNDAVAGHEYRLEQARRLIRCRMQHIQAGDKKEMRQYLNVVTDRGKAYKLVDDIVLDDELRAQAFRMILRDMRALQRKLKVYRAYALQFGKVASAIDDALRGLDEDL